MKIEKSDQRVEIKFQLKKSQLYSLFNELMSSKYNFISHHNERTVNSIYFDSHNNKELKQSLEGYYKKKKLRYRFYGIFSSSVNEIEGQWEVKEKTGILTNKSVHKENILYKEIFKNNISNLRSSNKQINTEIISYPYFSKMITYQREYFISQLLGDDFRLTIDKNIISRTLKNGTLKRMNSNDYYIVELKIENHIYENSILENFKYLNRVGFSKYVEL